MILHFKWTMKLELALEDHEKFILKTDDEPELKGLVENLHDSHGTLIIGLVEAIFYFLRALDELTEFQLLLLAESVEKNIVPKMLTVVKSILDHNFSKKEGSFTTDVQFLTELDLSVTVAMIESSGATAQKTGTSLAGTGGPTAFPDLSALYVALYVLSLLSK